MRASVLGVLVGFLTFLVVYLFVSLRSLLELAGIASGLHFSAMFFETSLAAFAGAYSMAEIVRRPLILHAGALISLIFLWSASRHFLTAAIVLVPTGAGAILGCWLHRRLNISPLRHRAPSTPVSNKAIAAVATCSLLLYVIIALAIVGIDAALLTISSSEMPQRRQEVASLTGLRELGLLAAVAVLFGTLAVFLTWVYRAYVNLVAFGVNDLKYSPWSAVVAFIVPMVNVWLPYRVLGELSRRSGALYRGAGVTRFPIVGTWWASLLAVLVFSLSVPAARGSFEAVSQTPSCRHC